MRRIILSLVLLLLLAIFGLVGLAFYKGQQFLMTPPESPGRDIVFSVKPGQTFDQVAKGLEEAGLITNAHYFGLLGKYKHMVGSVQAGDFQMSTGWRPMEVLEHLVSGKPILYRLSIREGLTWWQTAEVIEEQGFANATDIEALAQNATLLQKYNIPYATAEGFLFPETYLLKKPGSQSAQFIVEMLLQTFWKQTDGLWPTLPNGEVNATAVGRLVNLASLVEKETAVPEERRRVAGVYVKRLARNMLLQCDPTIIYGLGKAFDGNIRRVHINDPGNPYNTYQHPGLPPGPIASPGLASIKAALDPEEHDYLYFVSRGDGSHVFSTNLQDHNRAVRKYQLGQ